MSYTAPIQPFVNNPTPVGGGVGPALDAGFFNGVAAGAADASTRLDRIGAPNAAFPGNTSGAPPLVSPAVQINNTGEFADDWPLIKADCAYLATDVSNPFDLAYLGIYSNLNYGSTTVAAKGTAHTITTNLAVKGSASVDNEFANFFGVQRFDNGTRGNAWFTDWNLHGPIAAQPGLLNGLTMFINNYNNGSPARGPSGNWIVTRTAGGGGGSSAHTAATTYPVDVGLGIVGYSGVPSSTKTTGFNVGIQVGGQGSGWMALTDTSSIGTGVRILNTTTQAIRIDGTDPAGGAISWNGDTNLYRSTTGLLRTDSSVSVVGSFLVGSTTADAKVKLINTDAVMPTLYVRNTNPSAGGDLLTLADQASGTVVLSRFDKAGYFMTRKAASPALGDMSNGELALWIDSSGNLKVTSRIAGALKTGTVTTT